MGVLPHIVLTKRGEQDESTEELTRTALLLTQLGTTLATLAGLQNLNQSSSSQELADLSGLR